MFVVEVEEGSAGDIISEDGLSLVCIERVSAWTRDWFSHDFWMVNGWFLGGQGFLKWSIYLYVDILI